MSRKVWSASDDDTLRRLYPNEPTSTIAAQLGRTMGSIYGRAFTFGLKKSAAYNASPAACRLRRGDAVGKSFRFLPGHVPANKGLRRPGYAPGRMKETQFRPNERRGVAVKLYKPVGTQRISKDGYLERKVNDDMPLQRRWRAEHLIMWEAANGPLPAGHAVVFLNGDKRDIRLDNLGLITRADLMRRNTIHNLYPELKETIQLKGRVNRAIKKRMKSDAEKSSRRSA
jgi:hypothetical protein